MYETGTERTTHSTAIKRLCDALVVEVPHIQPDLRQLDSVASSFDIATEELKPTTFHGPPDEITFARAQGTSSCASIFLCHFGYKKLGHSRKPS
jgi:hypothetical protein